MKNTFIAILCFLSLSAFAQDKTQILINSGPLDCPPTSTYPDGGYISDISIKLCNPSGVVQDVLVFSLDASGNPIPGNPTSANGLIDYISNDVYEFTNPTSDPGTWLVKYDPVYFCRGSSYPGGTTTFPCPFEEDICDQVANCPGVVGPPGPQGEQGIQGETGAQGIQGEPGPQGEQGVQGVAGTDGQDGTNGTNGVDGQDGATGPAGPTGPAGQDGADGTNGTNGTNGTDGINCWDLNTNGINDPSEDINNDGIFNTSDCQGPGGTGVDGINCWDLNGNGINDPSEDVNSDGFFNATDCQGPQGDQGIQGVAGTNGIDGADGQDGTNGIDGVDGQDGTNGTNGTDGVDGQDGATGPIGPVGPVGPAGADGTNGTDGQDGATGPAGQDGADGTPDTDEQTLTLGSDTSIILSAGTGGGGTIDLKGIIEECLPESNSDVLTVTPLASGDTLITHTDVDGNTENFCIPFKPDLTITVDDQTGRGITDCEPYQVDLSTGDIGCIDQFGNTTTPIYCLDGLPTNAIATIDASGIATITPTNCEEDNTITVPYQGKCNDGTTTDSGTFTDQFTCECAEVRWYSPDTDNPNTVSVLLANDTIYDYYDEIIFSLYDCGGNLLDARATLNDPSSTNPTFTDGEVLESMEHGTYTITGAGGDCDMRFTFAPLPIARVQTANPDPETGVADITWELVKSDGSSVPCGENVTIDFCIEDGSVIETITGNTCDPISSFTSTVSGTASVLANMVQTDIVQDGSTVEFDKQEWALQSGYNGSNYQILTPKVTVECNGLTSTNTDNFDSICKVWGTGGDNQAFSIASDDGTTTIFNPFSEPFNGPVPNPFGDVLGGIVQAPSCAVRPRTVAGVSFFDIFHVTNAAVTAKITLKKITLSDGSVISTNILLTDIPGFYWNYPKEVLPAIISGMGASATGISISDNATTNSVVEGHFRNWASFSACNPTALPVRAELEHTCDPSIPIIIEFKPIISLQY